MIRVYKYINKAVLFLTKEINLNWTLLRLSHLTRHHKVRESYIFIEKNILITPPRNHGGGIFSLQFVCLCVCMCVCVRLSVWLCVCQWTKFQPNGSTDLDTFLLGSCLLHRLGPKWNWWPWVKGQGHNDAISIFPSQFSVNFPTVDLGSLMSDQYEFW